MATNAQIKLFRDFTTNMEALEAAVNAFLLTLPPQADVQIDVTDTITNGAAILICVTWQ